MGIRNSGRMNYKSTSRLDSSTQRDLTQKKDQRWTMLLSYPGAEMSADSSAARQECPRYTAKAEATRQDALMRGRS